jgi:hypothetical protein
MAKKANKFVPKYVPYELQLEKHPEKVDSSGLTNKNIAPRLSGEARDFDPTQGSNDVNNAVDEKGNAVPDILKKGLARGLEVRASKKAAAAAAAEKEGVPVTEEEGKIAAEAFAPKDSPKVIDKMVTRRKSEKPRPFVGSKDKEDFVTRSRDLNPDASEGGRVVNTAYEQGDIDASAATTAFVDYPDTFEELRRSATNPGAGRTIGDIQEDYKTHGDTFETSGADVAKARHMNPRAGNPTDVPNRANASNRTISIATPNNPTESTM